VSKKELPPEEPLNLVPIMNLVTILIPVLLMAIKSLELAVIDTTLPAIGQPTEVAEVPQNPPLALKLAVTNMGIRILGANNYLYPDGAPKAAEGEKTPPTVPCKSNSTCRGVDDYNWGDLGQKLYMIKQEAQKDERDSDNIVLIPESNLRYEILVKVMDISRNNPSAKDSDGNSFKLFPNVVLAGGTNQ
jgi:hypothetical protein